MAVLKEAGICFSQLPNRHNVDPALRFILGSALLMVQFKSELNHRGPIRAVVAKRRLCHPSGQDDMIMEDHLLRLLFRSLRFGRLLRHEGLGGRILLFIESNRLELDDGIHDAEISL